MPPIDFPWGQDYPWIPTTDQDTLIFEDCPVATE
jgi:hypothetical protein